MVVISIGGSIIAGLVCGAMLARRIGRINSRWPARMASLVCGAMLARRIGETILKALLFVGFSIGCAFVSFGFCYAAFRLIGDILRPFFNP